MSLTLFPSCRVLTAAGGEGGDRRNWVKGRKADPSPLPLLTPRSARPETLEKSYVPPFPPPAFPFSLLS